MTIKSLIRPDGRTAMLGRTRPRRRARRLPLRRYADVVPVAPTSTSYATAGAPSLKKMYMNDQLGCCVVAGCLHACGVITGNAGDSPALFTDPDVVRLYGAIGGYVPGDPSTDQGCDELTALDYWKRSGLGAGGEHKIEGRLTIDARDEDEVRAALWLFENLIFGVELPGGWLDPFPDPGFTWDVAGDPVPENGHCFVGVDYGPGGVEISTWGMTGKITWPAVQRYVVAAAGGELHAALSRESINRAAQRAPNGLDWDQLAADLAAMGGV